MVKREISAVQLGGVRRDFEPKRINPGAQPKPKKLRRHQSLAERWTVRCCRPSGTRAVLILSRLFIDAYDLAGRA